MKRDLIKILMLIKKSIIIIKYNGIIEYTKRFKNSITFRIKSKIFYKSVKIYADLLFINGCTLPHPSRYRVDHQIEQLYANNIICNQVFYENLKLDMLKHYRGFIFFRCPITETVREFIYNAKIENKTVFFDIDDLVIDKKYTSNIRYLKTLSDGELAQYDDGVIRMQETLKLCDYAITTTERLATELSNYVSEVFINRNVASEKMVELSNKAIENVKKDNSKVIMGYFSGSITHNADFELILPVIIHLMQKYSNLYLKVVGLLDIPKELKPFKERLIKAPFVSWVDLPNIIASVDINLAPLEDNIFNEAKSENKWIEAALCKVVTIASNVGAFEKCIEDGKTGVLCSNQQEWLEKLDYLITNQEFRNKISLFAYEHVNKKNISIYTGFQLTEFINNRLKPNIAFILPSTEISGGVNVAIKHIQILKNAGYDVFIISEDNKEEDIVNKDGTISVLSTHYTSFHGKVNTGVATLWTTLKFLILYPNILNRKYLVQNFETNFYKPGQMLKIMANSTYNSFVPIEYITISKWCENWLKVDFHKKCRYVPNGINLKQFPFIKRDFNGKIKILIEGNSNDFYKNVDESFRIVEKLDKSKFEIHYLSYKGKPKSWYHVDKFMNRVPYDEVGKVYGDCHILIKSSKLESFSYPPLEMMATGGIAIVAPNEGNIEYLKDKVNCLLYEPGNIKQAAMLIELVCKDENLRNMLIENGQETAKSRAWEKVEQEIIDLYAK